MPRQNGCFRSSSRSAPVWLPARRPRQFPGRAGSSRSLSWSAVSRTVVLRHRCPPGRVLPRECSSRAARSQARDRRSKRSLQFGSASQRSSCRGQTPDAPPDKRLGRSCRDSHRGPSRMRHGPRVGARATVQPHGQSHGRRYRRRSRTAVKRSAVPRRPSQPSTGSAPTERSGTIHSSPPLYARSRKPQSCRSTPQSPQGCSGAARRKLARRSHTGRHLRATGMSSFGRRDPADEGSAVRGSCPISGWVLSAPTRRLCQEQCHQHGRQHRRSPYREAPFRENSQSRTLLAPGPAGQEREPPAGGPPGAAYLRLPVVARPPPGTRPRSGRQIGWMRRCGKPRPRLMIWEAIGPIVTLDGSARVGFL